MLKVLPIQSKAEQEALCLRCHVKFDPDLLAYAATVDDDPVGICQFKLTEKSGLVYDIAPTPELNSFEALFVMGRGTLNFIDLCGVHHATYVGKVTDEPLLRAIGFQKTEAGTYEINLEGFFTDHCHNHSET